MSDILERLREEPKFMAESEAELMHEAANEIEDLRAKLELLRRIAGKASVEGMTFSDIKKEIRK